MDVSSRSSCSDLTAAYTLIDGESCRVDSIMVSNNTASPVEVEVQAVGGASTYCHFVVPAFSTVTRESPFIADKGIYVPLVDANVHISFCHSAGGV